MPGDVDAAALEGFELDDAAELIDPELRAAGIPCGPINTVSQIFHDPHIQARDFVWECEHPTAGRIKLSGSPIHLSETPTRLYKAPPLLGEDDDKV